MIVVLQAHPYPDRSRANRLLTAAIADLPGVEIRWLYDLYPDFAIDVETEQRSMRRASTVVWQHPLFWYSAPALLKLWFEKVLTPGWAYGPGGTALQGKRCLWVITTGGAIGDYSPEGLHRHELESFLPVTRQTAQFCRMNWLEPLVVHDALRLEDDELARFALRYRERLIELGGAIEARDE